MMQERLQKLEKKARVLDLSPEKRRDLLERVARHSEEFLEGLPAMPAYQPPDDSGGTISDSPICEEPGNPEEVLGLLRDHVDRWGANVPSGGHMGYIPGSSSRRGSSNPRRSRPSSSGRA